MRRCAVFCLLFILGAGLMASGVTPAVAIRQGKALEKAQEYRKALLVYKKSLQQKPSREVYREAASLMGKLQKYDNAKVLLQRGLRDFPNDAGLMNLFGLIQLRKGAKDDARVLWEKVLQIDPENTFAKGWLKKLGTPDGKLAEPDEKTDDAQVAQADDSTDAGAAGGMGTPAPGVALPIDEQKNLAKSRFEAMMTLDKWGTDQFESMYREIIDKCPDIDAAQESCWRLSNMYLLADDPPNYDGIIEVLEHLVTRYPDSPLVPEAKNRLVTAYQKTGRYDGVVRLYEDLFQRNPKIDDLHYMIYALEYADALAALGRSDDAREYYQKVLQKDDNRDSLQARVARRKLAEM